MNNGVASDHHRRRQEGCGSARRSAASLFRAHHLAVDHQEVEEKRPSPTAAERIQREGNLLLQAVPKGAIVVALDGKGTQFTSEEFAQRLGKWRDTGVAEVIFLIGGADGLAENVRAKANYVMSLGAMTWPHLLARGMLLEQIYRAQTILAGHPYHRA